MPTYVCERCHKEFRQKSGIKRHMARKRPCAVADRIEVKKVAKTKATESELFACLHCGKGFKHYQSRWRHERKCTKQRRVRDENSEEPTVSDMIRLFQRQNTQHEEEKKSWESEKAELKTCICKILEKVSTPTPTTIMQHNTYNIVQINNFGKEDTSHIETGLLQKLLKTPGTAVPELLRQIHFHPDHPENRNVKITNKRERYAHVFRDQQWQLARKDDVLDKMVESGFSLLDSCFEGAGKSRLTQNKQRRYKSFQQNMDDTKSDTRRRVCEDTEIMVLNNSKT
jgi:hypothetical protein